MPAVASPRVRVSLLLAGTAVLGYLAARQPTAVPLAVTAAVVLVMVLWQPDGRSWPLAGVATATSVSLGASGLRLAGVTSPVPAGVWLFEVFTLCLLVTLAVRWCAPRPAIVAVVLCTLATGASVFRAGVDGSTAELALWHGLLGWRRPGGRRGGLVLPAFARCSPAGGGRRAADPAAEAGQRPA